MNNYPPGAANDPLAPYNQIDPPEVDIKVTETLVKETCIASTKGHMVPEFEIDPDSPSGYTTTSFFEPGDVDEDFRNQCRTAEQCLDDCCKVLKNLKDSGVAFIAHIDIRDLYLDCQDWVQENFEIETF